MQIKLAIRQFYKEKIGTNYEESICYLFPEKFEIGGASFSPEDTFKDENINIQEFAKKALKEEVPTGILNAFKRHIWYAKHSASDICIYKVPVNKHITYAICINGYVDDGWDNGGNFIEVYDEQGELMGAKILGEEDGKKWKWMDRPILSHDFHSFTPPWLEEEIL
ncbi:MAG: hypothetical protein RMY28_022885 [Nostoc sp. ChiSLP01]|nr:hypothetical protein [Nostoc sp. CmiSLP01]MDZ8282062.1 hypothetical protein [Nostoc sp. ChiSLP01]